MTAAGRMKQTPATSRPEPAAPRRADVDGQLGRVGAGDEVGGAEQVEELLARQPAAPADDLVLHHRDVRRGAAEGRRAQPQEEPRQLAERRPRVRMIASLRAGRFRIGCHFRLNEFSGTVVVLFSDIVSTHVRAGRGRSVRVPFCDRASAVCRITLMVLTLGAAGGCDVNTALEHQAEVRRLAASVLIEFTKAADASNRAVMADTDASVAFAREAEESTQAAQTNPDALGPLLRDLGYSNESRLLEQFVSRFAEYRGAGLPHPRSDRRKHQPQGAATVVRSGAGRSRERSGVSLERVAQIQPAGRRCCRRGQG